MKIRLNSWSTDRYVMVEGDGSTELLGYTQRPTAIRKAQWSGHGCFDTKEEQLIVPVDYEKRIAKLTEHEAHLKQELLDAGAKLRAVKEAWGQEVTT